MFKVIFQDPDVGQYSVECQVKINNSVVSQKTSKYDILTIVDSNTISVNNVTAISLDKEGYKVNIVTSQFTRVEMYNILLIKNVRSFLDINQCFKNSGEFRENKTIVLL